jgi:hypothetical protein
MAKNKIEKEITKTILNPFGTSFEIVVDNYLGKKSCIINFPTRVNFYSIIKKIQSDEQNSEYLVGEQLLNDGFVSGDQEFLTDDIYIFMGAMEAVSEFEKKSSFITSK